MSSTKFKPRKLSLIEVTNQYHNNEDACYKFFYNAKYPQGYYCEKCGCTQHYKVLRHRVCECANCGHQEYLFAGTIFQDNKLPLFKLILGLYLFFVSNTGISANELANQLDINRKTAQLFCRKCRILMSESNATHTLNSLFYEADVAFIGAQSTSEHSSGKGTDQQDFLAILSTGEENKYPQFIKLYTIPADNGKMMERLIKKSVKTGKERKLNTDGSNTFNTLKDVLQVNNQKIVYSEKNHRLKWLNIIIGNVKIQITGIYHGVEKRSLQMYLQEQEYRFNHRFIGKETLNKVQQYIRFSSPHTRLSIQNALDVNFAYFVKSCV